MSVQPSLPFAPSAAVVAEHELLYVTCAPGLGWWAECECGWISRGKAAKRYAELSHESHLARVSVGEPQ